MPMNRALYPANWDAIAYGIKVASDWKCKACDKQCLRPHETQEAYNINRSDWARRTLTVHHIDHIPRNCDRSNLIALCAPCHRRRHARDKRYGKPNNQQLNLITD